MPTFPEHEVFVRDLGPSCTVILTVRYSLRFRFRVWVAVALVRLASILAGASFEDINIESPEPCPPRF